MKQLYQKLVDYWTLTPPVFLEHQEKWDGVTIVPECQEDQALETIKDDENVTIFSTEKGGRIVRKFGDILKDEEVNP